MNTNESNFKLYYKYLIKTFGHADCVGCRALAFTLDKYTPGTYIQDIYKDYADIISSTPSAVERSIRVYLNCILKDYSIEDLSTLLDYAFKPGQTTIKASEFIPVVKFILDDEEL